MLYRGPVQSVNWGRPLSRLAPVVDASVFPVSKVVEVDAPEANSGDRVGPFGGALEVVTAILVRA